MSKENGITGCIEKDAMEVDHNNSYSCDEYDDIFNSSAGNNSFQHATLIATLAERISPSFKKFQ